MVFLWVLEREEKSIDRIDAIMDLLGPDNCWSRQVLGLSDGLFAELESVFLSLEEKCVVPEWQEKVVVEGSVFNA